MISLRSFASAAGIAVLALFFTACKDGPTAPAERSSIQPGGASYHYSTGTKSINGLVDARVLINKAGAAILDVHSGTFDDATNTGAPNGVLTSIVYTVKDASGKKVASRSINLSGVTNYVGGINLCSNSSSDHDDDSWTSCGVRFASDYSLTLAASLKGVGGDGRSTGSGNFDAQILNLPDLDLTNQNIFVVGAGDVLTPATTVAPSMPTTFAVNFPNNKAINGVANRVAVQTLCIVTVDGKPQVPFPSAVYNKYTNPNAFGYIGDESPTIAAGATGQCRFTLSLPAGPHKIVVTAGVLLPGDWDLTNNSTADVTVNAAAVAPVNVPVDLLVKPIERVGNGVNAATIVGVDTAVAGSVITVRSTIQNSSTAASAVDCSINAPLALKATPVGVVTNVTVPANGSAVCQYTLSASGLGNFPVSISVVRSAGSPTDPNAANNSSSATLRVVTGGKFSAIDLSSLDVQQQWYNAIGATAFPADSLTLQNVRTGRLALVVVPTQDVIGTFTLKGTVINGSTTFPTGIVTGTLNKSASGISCGQLTAGPNASFSNPPAGFPAQIGYYGEVCAEPTTVNGVGGYHAVSVGYVQSLASSVVTPGQYLLSGTVQIKIELSFTLQGSTTSDKATATINISVPPPTTRGLTNFDGTKTLWTAQNPGPGTATTP